MCLGKNTANETFIFKNLVMKNSKKQKKLAVTIDNELNCKSHIKALCKKAQQKKGHYQRSQINSILKSQFIYCPLLWMFCSRTSNSMIHKVHERPLRVVLNDHTRGFKTLLRQNNDVCNHHRNIQTLLLEIFKTENVLAPPICDRCLKREIPLATLENFKSSRQKEKD